jgi:hypothetical protein
VSSSVFESEISTIYEGLDIAEKLDQEIFRLSMIGFNNLKQENEFQDISIITIIDFSKPSTEERLFVIDLKKKKVLYSSLVAHGKNSGWNFANKFSNVSGSLMSSLGFFRTSDTYFGKHGYSLRLEGLESSFNGKAEDRAIVIHKARYVSEGFIKKYGRLGRSWGCPALPIDSAKTIIDEIKSGTCLFIYADDDNYLNNSEVLQRFSDNSAE